MEHLEAIEAIKRVKARYFRHLDCKEWSEWGQVFTDDAVMVMPEGALDLRGREAIVQTVREILDSVVTIHHGHMPEIDILGETAARGIWSMEDYLIYPNGQPTKDGHTLTSLHGYGHYRDEYRRAAAGWQISRTQLSRLHVETIQHRRSLGAWP
jgi:hypothetical protein